MDWTTQYTHQSEEDSAPSELSYQTVALRDLELPRWKSAESYQTSTSNEVAREDFLTTSLDTSGVADATSLVIDDDDFDLDSMSSAEDVDDSPELEMSLAYARFHGLCRDYEMDDPLMSDLIPLPEDGFCCDDREFGDGLQPDAILGEEHSCLNERLDVDKDAATFLMSTLGTCKQYEGEKVAVDLGFENPKGLKLELPVLAGDHEMEMITLRRRNEVRLSGRGIKPFQLDNEKGESREFSSAEKDNKHQLDVKLRNEKLDVGKETVDLLRQLRPFADDGTDDYASAAYASYKKGIAIRVSPPLLPVTPPYSPPAPMAEAMQIDLASTPEDLIAKDAAAVEKELLALDQASITTPAERQQVDTQEMDDAIESYTAVPSSSSPLVRKRIRNLRLETPLTPQYHSVSSSESAPTAKKSRKVQFDLHLASLLPGPQTESSVSPPEFTKQRMNELQEKIIHEAESVEEQLRNEQLIEIDTTMRVKVPSLGPVHIHPPWDVHSQDANHTDKELIKDVRKCGGVAKIERSLQWAPFASYLAKVDTMELFDDGSLSRYLSEMDLADGADEVDVFALIARNDKSSLLPEHDSDDEDVEPVVTKEDGFVDEALGDVPPEGSKTAQEPPDVPTNVGPALLEVLRRKQQVLNKPAGVQPTGSGTDTGVTPWETRTIHSNIMQSDNLMQFMQLRGRAKKARHDVANTSDTTSVDALRPSTQNNAPAAVMVPQAGKTCAPKSSPKPIPLPSIRKDRQDAIPVIVSSAFMSRRSLVRHFQTILPNVDLCERDAQITPEPQYGKGVPKEADFTLSPSTGVVTTTLQKLKQKPLPGQMSSPGLRDAIASIAARYERLVVLVSEGNPVPTEEGAVLRVLDHLDCEALADLTGWANTIESDVQISYIPGGEHEIAAWLAASLSRRGVTDGGVRLLQDETLWERWLRVAGMNAHAAQAVLVRLKSTDGDRLRQGAVPKRFGLAAFVSMAAEERVERFAPILGGERVLRRVGEVIDGGWTSKSGT